MIELQLRRFEPFRALSTESLRRLARHVREIRVPVRRCLLQPGRRLVGRYFLLEGRVRLVASGGAVLEVQAGSVRACRAIYPGACRIEAVTGVRLLCLAPAGEEALQPERCVGAPEPLVLPAWQRRFLSSPLLSRLSMTDWQGLLRAMRPRPTCAGELLLGEGDPADGCYVLGEGRARVERGGRMLAELGPGQLFGEEALITGARRNADVVALGDGLVLHLPERSFRCFLLEVLLRPLDQAHRRSMLRLDGPRPGCAFLPVGELRHAAGRLDPATLYVVAGGDARQQALAAFILAEQGIDALPVAAGAPA
ncbi:MAG: cyclic nucleotide-binding domain-containing protein [Pseudomonadales bacterium]